jgi:hypothetical protein
LVLCGRSAEKFVGLLKNLATHGKPKAALSKHASCSATRKKRFSVENQIVRGMWKRFSPHIPTRAPLLYVYHQTWIAWHHCSLEAIVHACLRGI